MMMTWGESIEEWELDQCEPQAVKAIVIWSNLPTRFPSFEHFGIQITRIATSYHARRKRIQYRQAFASFGQSWVGEGVESRSGC